MASKGWQRRFDYPIPLPRGGQLATLKDAADYIIKLPKAEQNYERRQTGIQDCSRELTRRRELASDEWKKSNVRNPTQSSPLVR